DGVMRIRRRRPVEIEARGHDAPGDLGEPKSCCFVQRVAIYRQVRGQAYPLVVPGRFWVELIGEDEPVGRWGDGLQGEPWWARDLPRELAADQVDDVGVAALEGRQPRGVVGHHLEDEPLDARDLSPVLLVRLHPAPRRD